jgi:hypothetical protein
VIAGLLLAVGCARAGSVSVLLKQRGAVAAPTVLSRHPVRSAINLFRSKSWTVGWLMALGAWLLHVGALSLASLSIVQAVISGDWCSWQSSPSGSSAFSSGAGNRPGCWSPPSD